MGKSREAFMGSGGAEILCIREFTLVSNAANVMNSTFRQNSHLGVHQKTCIGEALGIPMWKNL